MSPLAILVSYHHPLSKRRAGFHFISDELQSRGYEVLFVTSSFSRLSRLKSHDHRLALVGEEVTNSILKRSTTLSSMTWEPWIHPFSLKNRWLDRLLRPVFELGARSFPEALQPPLQRAEVVILESCAGLSIAPKIRELRPGIRMAYRVSDDLPAMGAPQVLCDIELEAIQLMNWISSPCEPIRSRLEASGANSKTLSVDFHGFQTEDLSQRSVGQNPYRGSINNAVHVGISTLDAEWLRIAANLAPHWNFHIIGPMKPEVSLPNVRYLGEMHYRDTLPYIRFADYGLHTLRSSPALHTFTDTLKLQQYGYFNLPVLAPSEIHAPHRQLIQYHRNQPESIAAALRAAEEAKGQIRTRHLIGSWKSVVDRLLGDPGAPVA